MKKTVILIFISTLMFSCNKDDNNLTGPASDYLSTKRQLKTGVVDYGHHTLNPDFKDFIANNFDYVVTGEQDLDFAYYKNLNPDILIFAYWNSILLALDQTPPTSESAFLHDGPANNSDPAKRIGRLFDSDFYYVMNTGETDWQTYSLNKINQILANGFDGIHLDDVYAHLMHEAHFNTDEPFLIGQPANYITFTTVPSWYNAQQSHDDHKAYISFINDNANGRVIFNGINDLAENLQPISSSLHPGDYLNVCDGSIQEGFVYNGLWVSNPEDGFWGDEYWEAIVQALMDISPDKIHGVVSYGDVNYEKARFYSFASFLIGYEPNSEVVFYYTIDEFTLTYLPEWNLKIGKPVESYNSVFDYKSDNVFKREFDNALIIVNPYGSTTGNIELEGEYYKIKIGGNIDIQTIEGRSKTAIGENSQLQAVKVSSVSLEPYSAVILMK